MHRELAGCSAHDIWISRFERKQTHERYCINISNALPVTNLFLENITIIDKSYFEKNTLLVCVILLADVEHKRENEFKLRLIWLYRISVFSSGYFQLGNRIRS